MAEKTASPDTTLQIRRIFEAPRAKVFRAWTEPEELKKWFHPSDEYSTPIAEVDLRVGGRYRIGMKPPKEEVTYIVSGIYREVQPPEKLVYTWSWEGKELGVGKTLLTAEFRDLGPSTELILTHEFFPNKEECEKHESGWTGCLGLLAKALK